MFDTDTTEILYIALLILLLYFGLFSPQNFAKFIIPKSVVQSQVFKLFLIGIILYAHLSISDRYISTIIIVLSLFVYATVSVIEQQYLFETFQEKQERERPRLPHRRKWRRFLNEDQKPSEYFTQNSQYMGKGHNGKKRISPIDVIKDKRDIKFNTQINMDNDFYTAPPPFLKMGIQSENPNWGCVSRSARGDFMCDSLANTSFPVDSDFGLITYPTSMNTTLGI